MKKKILRAVKVLAALVVLFAVAVAVRFYALRPKLRAALDVKAPSTPDAIARGKYLANNVAACVGCHSPVREDVPGEPPVDGKLGSGRDFGDLPGFPGHLRAPNLTPDKDTGVGGWTDGEILRAMREGVDRNGRPLFPQMPYKTYAAALSDDDALAIVAYLRTLAPVKNDPGPMEVKFPVSMFIRDVPRPLETPAPAPPPATDKLARGRWLITVCSCHDCHDSVDDHMQKIPGKALAGNMHFPLPNGKGVAIAPNISSDQATGIGAYSEDDLHRVFDEGKAKSGRTLYTMPWSYYGGMTKEDKDALVFALKQEPAVSNVVPPSEIK